MQNAKSKIPKIDGSRLKIAIVLPYFNENYGKKLLKSTLQELEKNKVSRIKIFRVAGALELPFACQKLALSRKYNGIIALGTIIRGGTSHYEYVCEQTFSGLMRVQLDTKIPIAFGVLTCENYEQVVERLNKGAEAAKAILIQTTL